MTDISITIVAYNDEEDVRAAVCSIQEHTAVDVVKKIYIVDNSNQVNTLHQLQGEYSDVEYIKMPENVGFGKAHNHVLPQLNSKYHAIVNPDILLTEDSFDKLMEFMEKEDVGMAVPRLLDEEGHLQQVYRRELTVLDMGIRMFLSFGFKKRQRKHTMQDMDYTKPFQVPFAQGSFLVIQTDLFRRLQGFDERYFMYMEDADLCKRVNQCSRLLYCPDTSVIHKWARGSHKRAGLLKKHIVSMFRYFAKWGWKLW